MRDYLEDLARQAGKKILEVYSRDFNVVIKQDNSPVTEADHLANEVIVHGLKKKYPEIEVISEESLETHQGIHDFSKTFFIVDPLDGTKEFIKKNGEFTVNIAYVENGFPSLGVVYAPVGDVMYSGGEKLGSFKNGHPIHVTKNAPHFLRVVGSRSHMNRETEDFLKNWDKNYQFKGIGSSLKFCLVAEGAADLYPRIGPIKEWDTAAAQAVVEGAGGQVVDANTIERLSYGKSSLLSPSFLCVSRLDILGNLIK
ncbi:MAG: 3'(2'),5'-bisphosphate nucleotidase CysQ [Bacteriovoracaceae bacterium]